MKKRDKFVLSILIVIGLILISLKFDVQIIQLIEGLRNPFANTFFLAIEFLSNVFIIFFFLVCLFLWRNKDRKWVLPVGVCLFLSVCVSYLLKVIVRRARPFQEGVTSTLDVLFYEGISSFNSWNYSFPSFQTMMVFAVLPLINKEFRKFRHVWLGFAILVGFSRVYFGVHYLSDVISGGLIGFLIGMIVIRLEEQFKLSERIMKKLRLVKK